MPRVPQAMSRSPVGRVLERTQGEGSRQRARGSPSRGKKSACLASGRLRGAARTGTATRVLDSWTQPHTGHEHSRRRSRSGPSPAWPGSRCLSRLARQCATHLCQGQSEDVGEILVVAAFGLLPQDSVLIPPTEGAPKRTSGSMTTGDSRLASGRQRTAVSCSHVTRSKNS